MNVFRRVNRFTPLRQFGKSALPVAPRRYMGGGGGGNEPHVPEFHDKLGKFCLTLTFLWIFYRAKENRGQLFGMYLPWLDNHHHAHLHFVNSETNDTMPQLSEHEEEEEEEEDE